MNISFKTIDIVNFLSIGEASVSLGERGFTIVSGKNLESSIPQSNGSGKSSIFDAIFWTITGETLRGTSDVVNENREGGCRCTLCLSVDDKEYKIMRTKSDKEYGNSCYFYEDDELLSDQIRKSQEMIVKAIPTTSSDILGSIILLGQGLPYRFSALSPSKRKDLLETMSGSSSKVDKLKMQVDTEEAEYSKEKSEKSGQVISHNAEVSGLQKSIDALQSQIESTRDPESLRSEIKDKEDDIKIFCEAQIEEIQKKIPAISQQKDSFNSACENLRGFISKSEAESITLSNQISQFRLGNCPTCGRPYDNQEESKKKVIELMNQREQVDNTLTVLRAKLSGLISQYNEATNKVQEYNNQINSLKWRIEADKQRIEELSKLLKTSQDLESKIEEINKEIRDHRIKVNDLNLEIEEIDQYIDCIGYLKRQLSRDFKGFMLGEVIKFLSSRSAYYSEYLFSNGKPIEVTLTGNKILISVGGRLYENLSGGERQRVDLAVQFALRDMLVVTSGFSCNLIVLDEAFDNLDAQGSESLINLVTSEFSDVDSVFVVTHHSTIAIPYDNSILVVKDSDGVSTVKEV